MNCTNKQQETAECEKRGCEGCFYYEKTANEMFAELGYTEAEKYKNGIEYINIDNDEYISFMDYDIQGKTIGCSKRITMQELQAINKKVQELRLERINIMEDEIKVGEYIRTLKGNICKVLHIRKKSRFTSTTGHACVSPERYFVDNTKQYSISKPYVKKHSSNIIDLIEVRRLCKWRRNYCNITRPFC